MSRSLQLRVTTPLTTEVEVAEVVSVVAEDASGSFGILPGHVDFLTVLGPSVLRWRAAAGGWQFCALRGGVLRVSGGAEVSVACREAFVGGDLTTLQARLRASRAAADEAGKGAKVGQARLHARAIRRIMRGLEQGALPEGAETELFQ